MQKNKMAVWEALQIAVKRREPKSQGENERYKHLNAEFQRMARRDKKEHLRRYQPVSLILPIAVVEKGLP